MDPKDALARVDPDSSSPLYRQIASAIRARIEAGELAPGDSLEPLREAAERWGVNLHTVRHAYASLARDGLLEVRRGPGGTRVRPDLPAAEPPESEAVLTAFLDETLARGRREFGLEPAELSEAIRHRAARPEPDAGARVWVVECSRLQCEMHIREIEERWRVDARAWVLGEEEGPPPEPAIATYFHFNDLRRGWPQRFGRLRFVDLRVDPVLVPVLRGAAAGGIFVCERDEPTARAVVADLLSLVPDPEVEIGTIVADDAGEAIREAGAETRIFCPPRVWADLPPAVRSDPRAVEIRYLLDPDRLDEVAGDLGWMRRDPDR